MNQFNVAHLPFDPAEVNHDFAVLRCQVARRFIGSLKARPGLLFVNPIVDVSTDCPSEQFFRFVRKRQSQWCKQANSLFGRTNWRRVSTFQTGDEHGMPKEFKYISRSCLYVGLYAVDGNLVPNHVWRRHEQDLCSRSNARLKNVKSCRTLASANAKCGEGFDRIASKTSQVSDDADGAWSDLSHPPSKRTDSRSRDRLPENNTSRSCRSAPFYVENETLLDSLANWKPTKATTILEETPDENLRKLLEELDRDFPDLDFV